MQLDYLKLRLRAPGLRSWEPELIRSLSCTISFFMLSFIFPTSLLEISTAGWLFVPTRMSCSSCVMLFPKIRHTSALCYGFLEVNVFWMDLQQTVYSGRVRGEILFGFALTYQKQVWNPRHSWRVLRSECRRITTHLRSKAEWNGSSVWGAAA